jgi:glycolate oxidase iron-sulfur subunit
MIKYRNDLADKTRIPLVKRIILTFYNKSFLHFFRFFINILHKTPLSKLFFIPDIVKIKKKFPRPDKYKTYDILLFPGCGLDIFNQDILHKIYRFLSSHGYSIIIPDKLVCCGFPSLSHGWGKKFDKLRTVNKKIISNYRFKTILIPCGTGVYTFKNYYSLNTDIYELTDFIYRFIKKSRLNEEYLQGDKKVSYHDPCHNLKSLNIKEAPRFFLRQMGGNFVDNQHETCCGFGGIFSMFFRKTSKNILKNKESEFNEIGAEQVVTACPGCYMHYKENSGVNIKHFIDILEIDEETIDSGENREG